MNKTLVILLGIATLSIFGCGQDPAAGAKTTEQAISDYEKMTPEQKIDFINRDPGKNPAQKAAEIAKIKGAGTAPAPVPGK